MILSSAVAWSEDQSISQQEIVVSASRIPGPPDNTPTSASTISQAEIQSLAPADVIDLLRRIPGLHIDKPGGLGGVSSIYLRGAEPNYTLVLVDGIPLNDPTNSRGGSFDVSSMDLLTIERVEVLRGPQSAMYGADAMAGVINFITAGGTATPEYHLHSGLTADGGDSNGVLLQGPLENKGDFAFGAAHVDEGERLEGSSFTNSSANAKANLQISDTDRLTLTLRASKTHGTAFPDDSGGPTFAKIRAVDAREATELSTGFNYSEQISDTWNYGVGSSLYRRRELFKSPGVAPGLRSAAGVPANSSETTFESVNLHFTSGYDWHQNLKTVVGADFKREFGTNNSKLVLGGAPLDSRFVLKRSSVGWFGESKWVVAPDLFVNGSARFDFLDDYGVVKSFSLGTVYDLAITDTLLKATWGEGFKLPSFYALGNDLVGDPNLKPELSRSFDLSLEKNLYDGDSVLGLSLFRNRYQNTIDFDSSTNRLVNRAIVSAWGGEADFSSEYVTNLVLRGHIAYVKTNIRGTNEKLKNRVKWKGGLNAKWSAVDALDLSVSWLWVGEVFSSSIPTGDRILGGSKIVGFTGKWVPNADWQVLVSIDNVFGANLDEAVGFATQTPSARISARYRY